MGAIDLPYIPPITVYVAAPDKRLLDGYGDEPGVVARLMEAAAKTGAELPEEHLKIGPAGFRGWAKSKDIARYKWPESVKGQMFFIRSFKIINAPTEALANMARVQLAPLVRVEMVE